MAIESATPINQETDGQWNDIDTLLDDVARLSRTLPRPQEFLAEVLSRAVRTLSASGGLIWIGSNSEALTPTVHADLTREQAVHRLIQSQAHAELVHTVAKSHRAQIVLPRTTMAAAGESANPTDFVLLAVPLAQDNLDDRSGVVEILQSPIDPPETQHGALRFLAAIAELIADHYRMEQVRAMQQRATRFSAFENFVARIHRSLDLRTTAYEIANEGRRFANCDRVTVIRGGGKSDLDVLAISGVDTLDPRANAVHHLKELVRLPAASGNSVAFPDESTSSGSDENAVCVEYCRKSQVRSLTVIPLKRDASTPNGQPDSEVIGILVGEQFSDSDSGFRERLESAATHAATALQNAVEYESLPFRSLLRRLRNSRRLSLFYKQPKFVCGLLALVSALLGMVFIPADFEVSGTGLMQPAVRRGVFAPTDGVVREVRVAHGERCAQNDVLAVLSKPQLEQELARITGELQTAQKRMDSIQAARLENTEQTAVARERYFHLTAEEEEVKALIQSLQSQRRVLDAQQSELTVRSPLAGQVLTWNVREILESRPVARGDLLMMVADVDGPWILEIQVPDDQIGYVLDAQDAGGTEPTVTFLLGTDPGTTYHGTLQRIGKGVETVDERSYVLVTAAIDKAQIPRLHPGATAIPRIHCGRRSLGFVWFHGLWNAIRTRLLF